MNQAARREKMQNRLRGKLQQREEKRREENDPKFEFWMELPLKVRRMTVQEMDLKTRFQLRATSKSNRTLIDTVLLHFDSVIVEGDDCSLILEMEYLSGKRTIDLIDNKHRESRVYSTLCLIGYLLKHSAILDFRLAYLRDLRPYEKSIISNRVSLERARIHNFYSNEFNENCEFFLRLVWRKVDEIQLQTSMESLEPLMKIKCFDYTKFLMISDRESPYSNIHRFFPVIQSWIAKNAPIGKKIIARDLNKHSVNHFIQKYASSIIGKHTKSNSKTHMIRMYTDLLQKHILAIFVTDAKCPPKKVAFIMLIDADTEDIDDADRFLLINFYNAPL